MKIAFNDITIEAIPGTRFSGIAEFYYDDHFEMVFAQTILLDAIGEFPPLLLTRRVRHDGRTIKAAVFSQIEDACLTKFADQVDVLIPPDETPIRYRKRHLEDAV